MKFIVRRVPPGGRIADAVVEQEIEIGNAPWLANAAIYDAKLAARSRLDGGALLLDVYDGAKLVGYDSYTLKSEPMAEGPRPSGGYPHHGCGSPMVPGDVLGLKPPNQSALMCVGCKTWVSAPATTRMAAQAAASAERRTR